VELSKRLAWDKNHSPWRSPVFLNDYALKCKKFRKQSGSSIQFPCLQQTFKEPLLYIEDILDATSFIDLFSDSS